MKNTHGIDEIRDITEDENILKSCQKQQQAELNRDSSSWMSADTKPADIRYHTRNPLPNELNDRV